jgi:hypothetical protein
MARKRKDEEEVVEGEGMDGAPAGAEFVPDRPTKAKSDAYTTMLILAFLAFLSGMILSGREAWEHYDVQFGMFEKRSGGYAPAEVPVEAPADAPGEAAPVSENP